MRRLASTLLTIALCAVPAAVRAESIHATAEFESERTIGTSRMPFTLEVDRTTSVEEARGLLELLARGGQGLLRSAIAGRSDGRIRLGALEFRVSVIVVVEQDDGRIYSVLTDRPLRPSATVGGDDSAKPFGVMRIEVDEGGLGEGTFRAATSLAIDDAGALVVGDGEEPGRLLDVRRTD
ncbi:MAG: hypothetical protein AB7G12_10265 [Thermoanaerobaculia bacterium]